MKKTLIRIFIASVCLCVLCVGILYFNKGQALSIPKYPLSKDSIANVLSEIGVFYEIEEDDLVAQYKQGQALHNLYADNNTTLFSAGISSIKQGDERALFISFPPFYSANTVSIEECEESIVLATVLFGGFKNEHQVFDAFIKEYGKTNTKSVNYESSGSSLSPAKEKDSCWEREIGKITCRIIVEQPTLDEPSEYIRVIMFASDRDTFVSEWPSENLQKEE